MGISQYIKQIGRRDAAHALTREEAADLFGQVLDGGLTDLEVGAFCVAMRLKGETPDELCGFLDATHTRLDPIPAGQRPLVVLPSYNGARRLPVLTPLLALLLGRAGACVAVHGTPSETGRVFASSVLAVLGIGSLPALRAVAPGEVAFVPTALFHPRLAWLLQARQAIGLRNPAHSVVKLMNPCAGRAVIVAGYTHREYGAAMGEVFQRLGATALLLRGTEGEATADPRRMPAMEGFAGGRRSELEAGQRGSLATLPELPRTIDAETTAAYTLDVLAGRQPVPPAVAAQAEHILRLTLS